MPRKRYALEKVEVEAGEVRRATWTFAREQVSGEEWSYLVTDGNTTARHRWEFIVRIPRAAGERIEVRPRAAPPVKVWAELPDRSLTFSRATKAPHRGAYYCPVALADVSGRRSRIVVSSDERAMLPAWFKPLERHMRAKESVRGTGGTDANSLVILVPKGDYPAMIRLFFATKVWILKENVTMDRD